MKREEEERPPFSLACPSFPPPLPSSSLKKKKKHQEAKSKFQSLQRIYAVLSDESKRASYDRSGSIDSAEGLSGESFDELYSYFRDKFKEVAPADIDDYEFGFRGSPEETKELFELYGRFRGSMDKVFEWLVCSDPLRDNHRFAAAVRKGIADKELEEYPAFVKWCKAKVDGRAPPAEVSRVIKVSKNLCNSLRQREGGKERRRKQET